MSVDAASLAAMEKRLGLTPLPTEAGLAALETLLTNDGPARTTVLHGDTARIGQVLESYGRKHEIPPSATAKGTVKETAAPAIGAHCPDGVCRLPRPGYPRQRCWSSNPRASGRTASWRNTASIPSPSSRPPAGWKRPSGLCRRRSSLSMSTSAGVAGHLADEKSDALRALFADDSSGPTETPPPAEPPRPARDPDGGQRRQDRRAAARSALRSGRAVARHVPTTATTSPSSACRSASPGLPTRALSGQCSPKASMASRPFPAERWNHAAIYHPERDVPGKTVVRTGAFLPDIDKFDPRYFRISQAEAELMSPEVRLFLEASVEAFEDAGYSRETMARRYGARRRRHRRLHDQRIRPLRLPRTCSCAARLPAAATPAPCRTWSPISTVLPARPISSTPCARPPLDLRPRGRPHAARRPLQDGACRRRQPVAPPAKADRHLPGALHDQSPPTSSAATASAPTAPFSARASAPLVLKPLADAKRDGDHIYGVIIGSGISNAGVRNGFTVPNPNQQAVAIEGGARRRRHRRGNHRLCGGPRFRHGPRRSHRGSRP